MKRFRIVLVLSLILLLAGGCSKASKSTFEPKSNGLFVTEDGTLSEADIKSYDQNQINYYEESGLKAYVEEAVKGYNNDKAGLNMAYAEEAGEEQTLPIAIAQCSIAEGNATVILNYQTYDDFLSFRDKNMVSGITVTGMNLKKGEEAFAEGSILTQNFVKPDGKAADIKSVKKKKKANVLYVEGSAQIQTEGKILFVSEGVEIIDNHTVKTAEGASYIVFN